jgi:hypothetical protein
MTGVATTIGEPQDTERVATHTFFRSTNLPGEAFSGEIPTMIIQVEWCLKWQCP